jgi:hypothetical protein
MDDRRGSNEVFESLLRVEIRDGSDYEDMFRDSNQLPSLPPAVKRGSEQSRVDGWIVHGVRNVERLFSGVRSDERAAIKHHRVRKSENEGGECTANEKRRSCVKDLPNDWNPFEPSGDGPVRIHEAPEHDEVDPPLDDQPADGGHLALEGRRHSNIVRGLGGGSKSVEWYLDDLDPGRFEALDRRAGLLGKNDERLPGSLGEWARKPEHLIMRSAEDWIVDNVKESHAGNSGGGPQRFNLELKLPSRSDTRDPWT